MRIKISLLSGLILLGIYAYFHYQSWVAVAGVLGLGLFIVAVR